jgi:hypothetical protein
LKFEIKGERQKHESAPVFVEKQRHGHHKPECVLGFHHVPEADHESGRLMGRTWLTRMSGMLPNGTAAGSLTKQVESSGSYNTMFEPRSYYLLY